ncbi:MAG: sigma-70 family RNA polymerase sigma factor [Actinobacteria bacterium]|nr:MAG: sigma-70 family RNA polymerase sigma factor [Actinomycetota bacterium]
MRQQPRGGPDLMRDFLRKDPSAAEEMYERFAPRVFGLGLVMLGNSTQAEDLVQDTFVKVWRSAASYDGARGSLDTWVLLIARSLAIDLIRRRVLETRTLAMQEEPEIATDPGPEERAEARDLVDRARAAMASLTPGQRAALELAYFQGKTSSEVAELEGIPIGTAKTRIRTALAKIREVLEVEREV